MIKKIPRCSLCDAPLEDGHYHDMSNFDEAEITIKE